MRQIENVGVIAPDGRLAAFSALVPAAGISLADRDFFKAHIGPPIGLFVSEVMRVGREEEPKFMISRRHGGADGSFAGVIFATVSPTALTDFYRSITDLATASRWCAPTVRCWRAIPLLPAACGGSKAPAG